MRLFRLLFALCLFQYPPLKAQEKVRLNNGWQFLKGDLGGIWEAVRPAKGGNPEDVPLWTQVVLPHCYNAEDAVDPDVNYYQGPAWYRTLISSDNSCENGRTLLHFEGTGQKADVYVYTTKVGSHVGGYDEWTVDITDAVNAFKQTPAFQNQFKGKVPLSVRVDNSRDLEMIPSNLSDFNLYGGIYRYANLVQVPAVSLEKVFALAEVNAVGKTGKVSVRARFYNPSAVKQGSVSVKLYDPSGRLVQQSLKEEVFLDGENAVAAFTVPSPKLWSIEKPQLYTVETTVSAGNGQYTHRENIGFRHFEFVQKGPFLLNGKRLLLQGTHRHEDHAGVGQAMTEEMMRTEMVMMKEMGVNFIRLGHYQQSKIILDLCDSLGIVVWEEIPWCRGGLGGEIYKEQARRMLVNMVEQHYNHPSVIIWGLGNENDWPGDFSHFDTVAIRTFMKELHDLSHRLDPTRKTAIRRCDFCKDIVDVYSPSIWAGWYRGLYSEYKDISAREFEKVNHFLHVEWGGDSHAGRHSENSYAVLKKIGKAGAADERAGDASLTGGAARVSKDGDWSESYICNLVDWHLKEQLSMPWLTGTAQWPFKDFSTPVRPDNPVPYMNQKGVVERDFTKKESFYVFQSYWATKPMAHIYSHSQPVRWGAEGEMKLIKVYSNCDEAELFVNGKSLGTRKRNSTDFPAAGLRWEMPMVQGQYKVQVIARKGKEQVEDQLQFRYQSGQWEKPTKLKMEKLSGKDGTTEVEITLQDANGLQCMDAANWVRFGVAGDGKLVDNLGTATGSRYVQLTNGRGLIRVKKTGEAVVTCKVEGVPIAFLNL